MIKTAVELARTGAGLINTAQPESDVIARRGVWIAGARHVVQAALTLAKPELRPYGVAADALHALSMIPVAVASKRFRRPALAQAAVAAALAGAEILVLRKSGSRSDSRKRRRG